MPLQHARLRFGAYDVDLHARELRKHGLRMKLENQPFEVLSALLENPGEIVSRAELQARLWPDGTFVDFDKSLTKAVNKLRSAFGDSASTPNFVETVSCHGYRFIAPVTLLGPDDSTPITNTRGNQPARKEIAAGHSNWIRWAVFVSSATVLLVLIGVIALESTVRTNRAGSTTGIHSLAVLPIQDLTGDAGQ